MGAVAGAVGRVGAPAGRAAEAGRRPPVQAGLPLSLLLSPATETAPGRLSQVDRAADSVPGRTQRGDCSTGKYWPLHDALYGYNEHAVTCTLSCIALQLAVLKRVRKSTNQWRYALSSVMLFPCQRIVFSSLDFFTIFKRDGVMIGIRQVPDSCNRRLLENRDNNYSLELLFSL